MKAAPDYQQTQQTVMRLLGWTEQEYADHIYETGLQYLKATVKDDTGYIIKCMTRSRVFWNWWKFHWFARDQAFAEQEPVLSELDFVQEIYHELHDPQCLASAIFPDGKVLEESYCIMIGDLNKEVVMS